MEILPYDLELSQNKTSRAIMREGRILIRLAGGLSQDEKARHIENLTRRMTKMHAKSTAKKIVDPFHDLIHGKTSLIVVKPVIGHEIQIQLMASKIQNSTAKKMNGIWQLRHGVKTSEKSLRRLLWNIVSSETQESVDQLIRNMNNELFQEYVQEVKVKLMYSRWGSCSLGRVITISTPLLFTTIEILRYVIIHELCHIRHPNHSHRFWDHVRQKMPAYEEPYTALRQYTLTMQR